MAEYANLRLANQLCFALYTATHAITRAYRSQLGELGLTYPQYLVLLALWDSPDASSRGQSVKVLAQRLDLDSAALTPLLKRMAAAGLVERERDSEDERVMRIRIAPAAQALKGHLARVQNAVVCRSGLSPAEFSALRDTLHRLTQTIAVGQEREPELTP